MDTLKKQFEIKNIWFWLIIPLSINGYQSGCKLDTGGNVFAGLLMLTGPVFFGIGLIVLTILLRNGLNKKKQTLILVSKIGLLLISFPSSYTAGLIFCHL